MKAEFNQQDLTISELRRILSEDEVNLIIIKRNVPNWIKSIFKVINQTKVPYQFWSVKKTTSTLHTDLLDSLNHFKWNSEETKVNLINEICDLANLFVSLTKDETPFISLRTIDEQYFNVNKKDVSKNLHIDTTVLTLFCTYCGKGTSWIENENILRDEFNNTKMPDNPTIMKNNTLKAALNEITTFNIGILKGEIRKDEEPENLDFILNFISKDEIKPFNFGKGLIHKGPGYKAGDNKRFLITISTMKIPDFEGVRFFV